MEHCPLIIGLTGGIASGKTTVTELFAEQGVPVIDADIIAHQLVQPGKPALEQIKEHFGTDICYPDGTLNRNKLRQHVFSHPTSRKQLEEILHPPIIQTLWAEVAQVTSPYCLLSVPLLIETQLYTQVDRVLVVDCTLETQRKRLKARDQLTDAQIAQIIATQAMREKRLAVATEVINNNSTKEVLTEQVTTLHKHYLTLATTHYPKKC